MPAFSGTVVHHATQLACEYAAWFSPDRQPMPWAAYVWWQGHCLEFQGALSGSNEPDFLLEALVRRQLEQEVQTLSGKLHVES